jgi:hypothetical protein
MKPIREILRSYAVFDAEGRHVNGTDKQSNHNYGDAYESLFPDRNRIELVMEVGVADGSCLLAWREVFPNATIVGMDIHHSDKAHGDRIEFYRGDQRSLHDCYAAVGGRKFDLIIDDATHNLEDTLRTLLYLWPFVKPNGIYVVEEFPNVGSLWPHIKQLFPFAENVYTQGPFGGVEPLIVLRKRLHK